MPADSARLRAHTGNRLPPASVESGEKQAEQTFLRDPNPRGCGGATPQWRPPTCVPRAAAAPLTVPVLLAVRTLLRVLQAQLVAHLEGLAHRPHDAHRLALEERGRG